MLFDLKRFFSAGNRPCDKFITVDLSQRDFYGSHIAAPVKVHFTAVRDEDVITLHIQSSAEVTGECARCLDPASEHVEVDTEFTVKPADTEDEDFELPLGENGALDVDEWVFQEFLFAVPRVLLCSPDCSGLCPVCGKKRQACTCQEAAESTPADARLSILKNLLN